MPVILVDRGPFYKQTKIYRNKVKLKCRKSVINLVSLNCSHLCSLRSFLIKHK